MIHIENFKNNKIFNELNKNPDSRKYSCKIFMSRDIFREIDPIFLSSKRISLRTIVKRFISAITNPALARSVTK